MMDDQDTMKSLFPILNYKKENRQQHNQPYMRDPSSQMEENSPKADLLAHLEPS